MKIHQNRTSTLLPDAGTTTAVALTRVAVGYGAVGEPCTYTSTLPGSRESPQSALGGTRVRVESREDTTTMQEYGKSDRLIVPRKPSNKAAGARAAAERA